jgi:mono/diheme cytochrome c family protein
MLGLRWILRFVLAAWIWYGALASAQAQPQSLMIADRGTQKTYTARDLLTTPALRPITLPDPVYRRSMTYKAIPMADLLKGLAIGPDDYVQATASDDFSVSIPARLLLSTDKAGPQAFLAIESPGEPWPVVPGKTTSAGTFYIVWQLAGATNVSSEYWAYRTVSLKVTDSPVKRWPALAVASDVPAADPIRRGLDRYVAVCMACHRFNGAGEAEMGPDLAAPMNPSQYFQLPALKKLLRDPSSVRKWPAQKMPAFDAAALSDEDIDAIVAWLAYKARTRP